MRDYNCLKESCFVPFLFQYPTSTRNKKVLTSNFTSFYIGVLLVGAFPGCPDDDENWELITSILSLGVTTFVCLQDEYSDEAAEEDWRN